ncbi:Stealth CR1 domain-containing protein [Pseudidiomarina aquimaris]|uniref:Stealth CR1 domain-containing protein n=1 Tax=Pseudidiomarina aquimaris TaxID=641841 RepID=UPI003A968DEF
MTNKQTTNEANAIDAVITWVDGNDPQHQAKLNAYLETLGRQPKSASATRFRECGELDYCVASLLQYAPFIRTIYIVTDQQTPKLLQHYANTPVAERIKIVDHQALFAGFGDVLPTFNSLTIETVLWRVPDLAEQFIYLNDDFLITKPLRVEDFFQDGRPVIRGNWQPQAEQRWTKRLQKWLGLGDRADDPSFKRSQELAAKRIGYEKKFYCIGHTPHPLLRSTYEKLYAEQPDRFAENVSYRLRNEAQFSPIALAHHWQLQNNAAIEEHQLDCLNIKPKRYSAGKLETLLRDTQCRFACIQSLDLADEAQFAAVMAGLDSKIQLPYSLKN